MKPAVGQRYITPSESGESAVGLNYGVLAFGWDLFGMTASKVRRRMTEPKKRVFGANVVLRIIGRRRFFDSAEFRSPPAYATGIQVHEIGLGVIANTATCKFACCPA